MGQAHPSADSGCERLGKSGFTTGGRAICLQFGSSLKLVEMPLKAVVRGYSYAVVAINWYGRVMGVSKLKVREMGSRYLFIVLYIFLERLLSRGDYHRATNPRSKTDRGINARTGAT